MEDSDFTKPFINFDFPDTEVNQFNAKIVSDNFLLLQQIIIAMVKSMSPEARQAFLDEFNSLK